MNDAFERRPYTFDRVVRMVIAIVCVVAVTGLVYYLRGALIPFFVACIIAYMLNPIVEWHRKVMHLPGRVIATVLTMLELIIILGVSLYFFIPYLYHEIENMLVMFNEYAQSKFNVPYLPQSVHDFVIDLIDTDKLALLLSSDEWINLFKSMAGQTWSFVGSTLSVVFTIVSWFIVPLYVLFILMDYDKVAVGIKSIVVPKHKERVFAIFNDVKDSMNRYFRGQALVSFFVGISFCIGFWIIGLPMAIALGMFIGLLNMVPYLQLISIPIAALLCLVSTVSVGANFWEMFGLVILVYCVSQLIQDLVLVPKIMGKYMGLNPAIIFLSLSIWSVLLGFVGLIIAVPLTTLLLAYYERYINHRDAQPWNKETTSKSPTDVGHDDD